jgi:hypothetical protein
MKIQISETKTVKKTIDVDFPIYRIHDVSNDYGEDTYYQMVTMIDGKVRDVIVHLSDTNRVEIEVDSDRPFYLLGDDECSSSKKEFDEAYGKMTAILDTARVILKSRE